MKKYKYFDLIDGSFSLAPDFAVNGETKIENLLKFLDRPADEELIRNEWYNVEIRNIMIGDWYFIAHFSFKNGILSRFRFYIKKTEFITSSNGFDETNLYAKEEAKLEMYEEWLKNEIGSQRVFNWGSINAAFDHQSISAYMYVVYNEGNK